MRSRAEILRMTSDRADTSQEMLRELELRPLHILEVDLADVARDVAAGFGASHRVAVDVPEGTVATDRDLVIEILTDLLRHALENAPDGSNVTICADSEKSGLRLWVSYDGAGIDPAHRSTLVHRFQQGDRPAIRPHGGPGVGLHLARDLGRE
jgi:signal transduction histidine kinase